MRLSGGPDGLPGGLRLVLGAGYWLYAVPLVIIVLFAVSLKVPCLRTSPAVSLISASLVVLYLLSAFLLLTPIFMLNLDYPSSRYENALRPEVLRSLEDEEPIQLISLSPSRGLRNSSAPESFHGYGVLGKVTIADPAQRTELVQAINEGIQKSDGRAAMCFMPRHAVQAGSGKSQVDLLICYECRRIEIHQWGKDEAVATTATSRPLFDKILQSAGIALTPEL
jgi:hypothetical protein